MPSEYIPNRIHTFDAQEAMTVIDYGCGSGRFTPYFAQKVGRHGTVYAVDIAPDAIAKLEKLVHNKKMTHVIPILANGYDSGLPSHIADRVYAIDMFHAVQDTGRFLSELHRLMKNDGVLYIDYGHQPKAQALDKIAQANCFHIIAPHAQHAVCKAKDKA